MDTGIHHIRRKSGGADIYRMHTSSGCWEVGNNAHTCQLLEDLVILGRIPGNKDLPFLFVHDSKPAFLQSSTFIKFEDLLEFYKNLTGYQTLPPEFELLLFGGGGIQITSQVHQGRTVQVGHNTGVVFDVMNLIENRLRIPCKGGELTLLEQSHFSNLDLHAIQKVLQVKTDGQYQYALVNDGNSYTRQFEYSNTHFMDIIDEY